MRLARDDIYLQGFFRLVNAENDGVPLGGYVSNGTFEAFNSSVEHELSAGQWVRVELRNIDWTAREYDLYIDCVRVAEGIALNDDSGDNIDRLELFNNNRYPSSGTPTVWYDEITFR
jgi:hypothetical protein